MSASTSKSFDGGVLNPQSGTEQFVDNSIYTYEIPKSDQNVIFYFLDQCDLWKLAAKEMGYTENDIIIFKHKAQTETRSPSDVLLSYWDMQNHTVTELFMVLNKLKQYQAMDCLRCYVHPRYHRLMLAKQPDLQVLNNKKSSSMGDNKDKDKHNDIYTSQKILNGPKISRECNESDSFMTSLHSTSITGFDAVKINEVASTIPQISYNELQLATSDWNEKNILGRGGFGIVFIGRWKKTEVAIKRIEYHAASEDPKKNVKVQIKQSLNELRYLNSCRHDNILPLYGYSIDGKEPCLVYQYMSKGSLEKHLLNKTKTKDVLPLHTRKTIAMGTARGLQYLHTFNTKPLIHGDIKPANILLDSQYNPKIGDFGLVREGAVESMEVSSVYGTRPYLPKEFLKGRTLSTKIDTYSYGVVLFELITGLRAYDKTRIVEPFLVKFMWSKSEDVQQIGNLMDKTLEADEQSLDEFKKIFAIALICTRDDPKTRPEMVKVLNALENFIQNEAVIYPRTD